MDGRFSRLEFTRAQAHSAHTAHEQTRRGTPERSTQHDLLQGREADEWGRFEEALRFFTRCLQADRATIPAWVGQVRMLVELGEYQEARLWSDKALEVFRNQGDLLAVKAQACMRLGDRRAAMACSDASLAAPGSSPGRWQARGEVVLARGDRLSGDCFERALAEPAADWFDHVLIARILLFHHHAAMALRYVRQALERRPDHAFLWYFQGRCQLALGWDGAARDSFDRSLQITPDLLVAQQAITDVDHAPLLSRGCRILKGWFRR